MKLAELGRAPPHIRPAFMTRADKRRAGANHPDE